MEDKYGIQNREKRKDIKTESETKEETWREKRKRPRVERQNDVLRRVMERWRETGEEKDNDEMRPREDVPVPPTPCWRLALASSPLCLPPVAMVSLLAQAIAMQSLE